LISHTLAGTSPQGEEDTLPACRILVRAMNRIGGTWNEPSPVEADDADCEASNATDRTVEPLRIQVVRAIVDSGVWQTSASSGQYERSGADVKELAMLMMDALKKKLDPKKIPPAQRPRLVLALDATRFPALAFDSVVSSFQEQHVAAITGTGFRSIWIVGPTESLTKRLDVNSAV
jgi:hypothetical protein